MSGILGLFQSVAESPRHEEYLREFLKSCTEHQAFAAQKSSDVQSFIKFTNSKLNLRRERLEGLLLLKTFLPQCSDEQFTDNVVVWMQNCVKGIESSACIEAHDLSYEVLGTLFEMSSNFSELTKNVNSTVLSKLVEHLQRNNDKPQLHRSALRCVQSLIRNYGAPCSSYRTSLEKYILHFADSKDPCLVSVAARAFSLLPLVGGGGTLATNHKTRWLEQQHSTCATLRELVGQLYENVNVVDSFRPISNHAPLPLEALKEMNAIVRVHQIANRLKNVTKFLEAMLLGEFPTVKSVLPDLIVGVVRRGLSVDCSTLGARQSSDTLAVSSVLPEIHGVLLRLLKALIACLGKNLYPYARVICKLSLQTLEWTSESASREHRAYATLRADACRVLEAWLRTAKAGSCVELFADKLWAALESDLRTEKTVVKLTAQPGKHNKKLRKKLAADNAASLTVAANNSTTGRQKLVDKLANRGPCLAATNLLYWLVHSAGVFIKPTLHRAIQETVLTVLYDIQRSTKADTPIPYSDSDCRLALYKLLTALTLQPHSTWPPPTQFALHVLARGQNDRCSQVSGYCTIALCSVEKLVHPVCQTLMFPATMEEMCQAGEDTGKPAANFVEEDYRQEKLNVSAASATSGPVQEEDDGDLSDEYPVGNVSIASNKATNNTTAELVFEDNDEDLDDAPYDAVVTPANVESVSSGDETDEIVKSGANTSNKATLNTTAELVLEADVTSLSSGDEGVANGNSSSPVSLQKAPPPTPSSPLDRAAKRKLEEKEEVPLERVSKRQVSFGLMGGSEVHKRLRFGGEGNRETDVVDLSSGEDGEEEDYSAAPSNVSVASSNSNYQDSVLNKSAGNEVDLCAETETLVLKKSPDSAVVKSPESVVKSPGSVGSGSIVHKSPESVVSVSSNRRQSTRRAVKTVVYLLGDTLVRGSPMRTRSKKDAQEIPEEVDLREEEEEVIEVMDEEAVVEDGKQNGKCNGEEKGAVAAKEAVVEDGKHNGDAEKEAVVDGEIENINGLTDEQVLGISCGTFAEAL